LGRKTKSSWPTTRALNYCQTAYQSPTNQPTNQPQGQNEGALSLFYLLWRHLSEPPAGVNKKLKFRESFFQKKDRQAVREVLRSAGIAIAVASKKKEKSKTVIPEDGRRSLCASPTEDR
jgi:hypothetical protein